jgi:HAMP domain-containing protein
MRIRTVFLLGFLAAALPGLGVIAWRAAEAWGAVRQAERAILATHLAALQRAQTGFPAQIGQRVAASQAPIADLEGTRHTAEIATRLLTEGVAAGVPEDASRTVAALLLRVEAARGLGPDAPQLAALVEIASHAMALALRDVARETALAGGEARLAAGRWRLGGMLALILGLLGLASAAITVLLHRVVRPLGALTGAVTRIAGGTLDSTVPEHGRTDERGEMAAAVERLRAGSAEGRARQAEGLRGQVDGFPAAIRAA